jgi:osmotically-inducible protein OsmY
MKNYALVFCLFSAFGIALAQQPVPMAKVNDSARNYRGADGSLLTSKATDDDLQQALYNAYGEDPDFSQIQVKVKKHRVTLTGKVLNRDVRRRAEEVATHTAGVRAVRNDLKVGTFERVHSDSALSSAH